jgi:hypothetical protein
MAMDKGAWKRTAQQVKTQSCSAKRRRRRRRKKRMSRRRCTKGMQL